MIKLSRKVLLLLVTLFILFAFTALKLEVNGSYRQHDNQITVSTTLQGISEDDIKSVQEEARSALAYISQILGISSSKNANIQILESGFCYATGETVSLSVDHVKDSSAPIIHEVTHILANHG